MVHDRVHSVTAQHGEQQPGQVAECQLVILLGVRLYIGRLVFERGPRQTKQTVLIVKLQKNKSLLRYVKAFQFAG